MFVSRPPSRPLTPHKPLGPPQADPEGIIDMETFQQIRDMDDEDEDEEVGEGGAHEFSKGIVWGYFEQAEATFKQMEQAMCVQVFHGKRSELTTNTLSVFLFQSNSNCCSRCNCLVSDPVDHIVLFQHSAEASLTNLSSLGHFLKGSSAALGIIKVQAICEKMQHYGNLRDEEAGESLQEDEALKRIEKLLVQCKKDYEVAKVWLVKLYASEAEE